MGASASKALSAFLVALAACSSGTDDPRTARDRIVNVPRTDPVTTTSPVEALITSAELAPYWHAERPGRAPLRIVKNPLMTDRPAFAMFGMPILWIEPEATSPTLPAVELEFQLVDGILNLSAIYRVEGVRARAEFFPDGSGWRQHGPTRLVEE